MSQFIDDVNGHPQRELEAIMKSCFREPSIDRESRIVIIPKEYLADFRVRLMVYWYDNYVEEFAAQFTNLDMRKFRYQFAQLEGRIGYDAAMRWIRELAHETKPNFMRGLMTTLPFDMELTVCNVPFKKIVDAQEGIMIFY